MINRGLKSLFYLIPILISFITNGAKDTASLTVLVISIMIIGIIHFKRKEYVAIAYPFLIACSLLLLTLSLTGSLYLYASIMQVIKLTSYLIYAIIIINAFDTHEFKLVHTVLIVLGLINCIIIYGQILFGMNVQGIFSPNPSYSATLCAVSLLISLFNISKNNRFNTAYAVAALFMAPALIFLNARAPLVGIVAGLIYGLCFKKSYKSALILLISMLFIVIALSEQYLHNFILHTGPYALGRLTIWKTASAVIVAHPLFGFGPGSFTIAYNLYRYPFNDGITQYINVTPLVHNDFLQIAAEYGLPVLFILLFVILRSLYTAYKDRRQDNSILISCSAAVTLGTIALLNFPLYLPFFNLVLCIVLVHIIKKTTPLSLFRVNPFKSAILVFLSAGIIFLLIDNNNSMPLKVESYIESKDLSPSGGSSDVIDEAVSKLMSLNPAYNQLLKHAGRYNNALYKRTGMKNYFIKSLAYYMDAVQFDPRDAFVRYKIGELYYHARQYDLALKQYEDALEAEPNYLRALLRKAECESQLNWIDESEKSYHQIYRKMHLAQTHGRAHPYITELLDIDPAEFYSSYSGLLFKQNKLTEASKYINKSIEISPENTLYLNNLKIIEEHES